MQTIMSYIFFLVTVTHSWECQTIVQRSDTTFKKAVVEFREKFVGSIKINKFPTAKDSSFYVTNLLDLLNSEFKTKAFNKQSEYSDFSFSTKAYNLTIHEILLAKVPEKLNKEIIKPKTEAPLQIQIRQFGNRVLLFSYSPFKFNDSLKGAIKSFESIYYKLIRPVQ